VEDYLRRFPQWATELRLQFEVHQAIHPESAVTAATEVVPGAELLNELGCGGMGIVYRARARDHGRFVAVKLLRPERVPHRAARKRFLAESRAVLALTHPYIIQGLDVGEGPSGPFYVMELIEGPSLQEFLRDGPVPIPWAAGILLRVAEAVEYAHGQGILHRDLKPGNILLSGDCSGGRRDGCGESKRAGNAKPGGAFTQIQESATGLAFGARSSHPGATPNAADRRPLIPKVTDFGMAKVRKAAASFRQSTMTQSGTLLGTPAFMPPEQTGAELSATGPFSDVYALGAVLYAMLTGRPPFDEGGALETVLKVRSPEPPPPVCSLRPDVPEALERICLRCLAKEPSARYPTALALAQELGRFLGLEAGARQELTAPVSCPVYLVDLATGNVHPLADGVTVLGRARDCDIVVSVSAVSRQHCRIVVAEGQAVIEDLGSLRGTLVNGQRTKRFLLHAGDRLDVAGRLFELRRAPE
jgi:serine/threonine protein kinase